MSSVHLPTHAQRTLIPSRPAPQSSTSHFLLNQFIDYFATKVKKDSESIEDYIELANLYRDKRQYRKAFLIHRNLLARADIDKTQKSKVYCEMGYDYLHSNTKDMGQKYFEYALSINKKNLYALQGLYQAFRKQRKFEDAMKVLNKIIKQEPDQKAHLGTIYAELAISSIHNNDIKEAKKWLKKSEGYPRTPFTMLTEIQLFLAQKQNDQAIDGLIEMILEHPRYASFPLSRLENLLFEMNEYNRYVQILNQCLSKEPSHAFVLHALAKYYAKTKQIENARAQYQKILDGPNPNIHILKDTILFFQKHEPERVEGLLVRLFDIMLAKKNYTCQSCKRSFDHVPKSCHVCRGWNLFDLQYTLRG